MNIQPRIVSLTQKLYYQQPSNSRLLLDLSHNNLPSAGLPTDQIAKAKYCPSIDKRQLFQKGYIGRRSAHSAGVAVDLALQKPDGSAVDFGSTFDLFDPRSATASPQVRAEARANRMLLKTIMERHGFANYPREWWHYSLRNVVDATIHDAPIVR